MDLVIKIENAEKLRYFQEKMGAKQLVIDVEKVIKDSEEFNKIFDDSCKKYVENDVKALKEVMEFIKTCVNCKYCELDATQEPCRYCSSMGNRPDWEPKEPRLKDKADLTYSNKPDYDSKPDDVASYNEEAEKSYFKTVTERMQSEFDATGKDVRIFMENKNIKPYFQVDYKDIGRPFQKKILKCPFCNTTYDDPFSTSKIYNGSWTKCSSCGHEVYIPKE